MADPSCPACGNTKLGFIGQIPDAIDFAGRERDEIFPGGRLWRCGACALWFRDPRLSNEKLDALYRSASAEAWSEVVDFRIDWQLAREELLAHRVTGHILDIGCWDGRFLDSLEGLLITKAGIEMNPKAAQKARESGSEIIADDLRSLARGQRNFSAITAFDVIEHVSDPLEFLVACKMRLAPGGLLLLATGNTASLPFRLLGGRYQYCIWPEHLVFLSPKWMEWAASQAGLEIVKITRYRREHSRMVAIVGDLIKGAIFALWPKLFSFLRKNGVGQTVHPVKHCYPPRWTSARDHFLTVLRLRPE